MIRVRQSEVGLRIKLEVAACLLTASHPHVLSQSISTKIIVRDIVRVAVFVKTIRVALSKRVVSASRQLIGELHTCIEYISDISLMLATELERACHSTVPCKQLFSTNWLWEAHVTKRRQNRKRDILAEKLESAN